MMDIIGCFFIPDNIRCFKLVSDGQYCHAQETSPVSEEWCQDEVLKISHAVVYQYIGTVCYICIKDPNNGALCSYYTRESGFVIGKHSWMYMDDKTFYDPRAPGKIILEVSCFEFRIYFKFSSSLNQAPVCAYFQLYISQEYI